VYLSHEALAAIQIPNTVQSLSCYAWLDSFFKLVGDYSPNSHEIHLENTPIKDIYAEYLSFMHGTRQKPSSEKVFGQLWKLVSRMSSLEPTKQ
jgi:hypothetical protein